MYMKYQAIHPTSFTSYHLFKKAGIVTLTNMNVPEPRSETMFTSLLSVNIGRLVKLSLHIPHISFPFSDISDRVKRTFQQGKICELSHSAKSANYNGER